MGSQYPIRRIGAWDLSSFAQNHRIHRHTRRRQTQYPIKMMRYWFALNLLQDHAAQMERNIDICEIGVDRGQLPMFCQDAGFTAYDQWDAVDYRHSDELEQVGYTRKILADVDDPQFELDQQYDAIVVLHLLEHLFEPERLVKKLAPALRPGGILIGGFPVTPEPFRAWWENQLRQRIDRSHDNFGHVSVFSPNRVDNMATDAQLSLEFLSGSFFMRKSGSPLEEYAGWVKINLAWGALFPSLGGEIYWAMQKHPTMTEENAPDAE